MTSPITLTVTLPRETCEVYLRAGMMPGGVSSAVARAIERWARAVRPEGGECLPLQGVLSLPDARAEERK